MTFFHSNLFTFSFSTVFFQILSLVKVTFDISNLAYDVCIQIFSHFWSNTLDTGRWWITITGFRVRVLTAAQEYYIIKGFFSPLPMTFFIHSELYFQCTVSLRFDRISLKLITEFLAGVSRTTKRSIIWIQLSLRGLNMHIDVLYRKKKSPLASSTYN